MQALTETVRNRDVKVHDFWGELWNGFVNPISVFTNPIVALIAPGTAIEMQELIGVRGKGIGTYLKPAEAHRYLTCLIIRQHCFDKF